MGGFKNYCSTHHFYYKSLTCPICEKERIQRLEREYVKINDSKKNVIQEEREITEEDINKLKNKFNV